MPTLTPFSGTSNPFLTTRVYRTQRHRKIFSELQHPGRHVAAAQAYLRYLCRKLPPLAKPRILELVWMQETSQPPPLPPAPVMAIPRQTTTCQFD